MLVIDNLVINELMSMVHDAYECFGVLALQENSDILTDIPTENEILRIYRGISEENSEETQNWVSSEYTDGIPRKLQSVGIFRGNSDELVLSVGIPSEFPRYVGRI